MTTPAKKEQPGGKSKRTAHSQRIFTIGHSNRTIDAFLQLLKAHGVKQLVDIRTIPRSRHNPQFNAEELAESLRAAGISYRPMKHLGGLRHAKSDSINTAWRHASFRGFADYMQTEDFAAAIDSLLKLAASRPTAIMCAEAVPWRCHRSLVADALVARGIPVEHIMTATRADPHKLTSFAKIRAAKVTYPGQANLPLTDNS